MVFLLAVAFPAPPWPGDVITGLDDVTALPDTIVFHAGTRRNESGYVTAGGRVLGVCARAAKLGDAIARAYAGVERVEFAGMQVRRDVGARAVGR